MATVLYVTCNLKPVNLSRSLTLGNSFIEEYLKINPSDRIDHIDLYRDPVQRIDMDVLTGWGKLRQGLDMGALSEDETRKILRINTLADKFVAADKYVFACPMWNLSFHAELKIFIDSICIVGKTITYTDKGAVGMLRGKNKKCLLIQSCGGFHHATESDHSVPYMRSIMKFMGVENFNSVVLEGVDAMPLQADTLMKDALGRCQQTARSF